MAHKSIEPENFKVIKYGYSYTVKSNIYRSRNQRISYDNINYKVFLSEYDWDPNKERNLHKVTKIRNPGRFAKRKWFDSTFSMTRIQFNCFKRTFMRNLLDYLMNLIMDDMVKNDNKIIFGVPTCNSEKYEGFYKIGAFEIDGMKKLKSFLTLSIVPYKIERITDNYPTLVLGKNMFKELQKQYRKKSIVYENLNIQERLAANNRLSGLYRCVRKPSTNKKTNIQSSHRFKGSNIDDNKDSSSS